jgi:hypothetical protein
MELVFTRPEIGTYILLSGDSDFASLVTKLKEYGKYVIGVGIKESSSDLLVMNCDEYYSYNALAGLVKNSDDEPVKKWDPWELVTEAVSRMKRNGDVMRSDRLKQVMVEIDSTFDEKDLGMAKFSRFVQDATQRGLLSATKLENGQLEIGLPTGKSEARATEPTAADEIARIEVPATGDGKREGGRGRRGRRGRGRDRDDRPRADAAEVPIDVEFVVEPDVQSTPEAAAPAPVAAPPSHRGRGQGARSERPPRQEASSRPERTDAAEQIGAGGERLTRDEAYDLVRRSVAALTTGDEAVRAGEVRAKARELLGRDSESLSDRNFPRILKDAHDGDVIDLRRRGDDFEIARAAEAESVSAQLAKTAANNAPAVPAAPTAPRGMGPRGVSGGRGRSGRPGAPPADLMSNLLSIGVVGQSSSATPAASLPAVPAPAPVSVPAASASTLVIPLATESAPDAMPAPKAAGRKAAAKKAAAPAGKPAARKASAAKKAPATKKTRAKRPTARAEA